MDTNCKARTNQIRLQSFYKDLKEYFEKRDIKEFDKNNVAYRQKLAKKQKNKSLYAAIQ